MLTIDTIPLSQMRCAASASTILRTPAFRVRHLFVFSVQSVATATATELLELKPVRRILFVLCRYVIAFFALGALQNDVISRHKTSNVRVTPVGVHF